MAVNPDFRDLFSALSDAGAEFIVVGAHAVMFYTEPRYTKDLDLWVRPTTANAVRVRRALADFGAPLVDLSEEDLATTGTIFQIGVAPNRIDILTSIEAVSFEEAYPRAVSTTYGGVPIRLLSAEDLVTNKRAVGRKQDEIDVEKLEAARRTR
jgi:predicted nucleotidyltransferase